MVALCPDTVLDVEHALTCKKGSDVITYLNCLGSFKQAFINPRCETGSLWGPEPDLVNMPPAADGLE